MEGFITTQVNTKDCAQCFKGLHKVLTKNQSFVEISASTKFSVRGREPLHKPAPVRWWPLQSRWCNLCQIKFFFLAFACQSPVMGLYIDTMVSHSPNTLGSSPPQSPLCLPSLNQTQSATTMTWTAWQMWPETLVCPCPGVAGPWLDLVKLTQREINPSNCTLPHQPQPIRRSAWI